MQRAAPGMILAMAASGRAERQAGIGGHRAPQSRGKESMVGAGPGTQQDSEPGRAVDPDTSQTDPRRGGTPVRKP